MLRTQWLVRMRNRRGASALTYGLVVGLVAIVAITAVDRVGTSVTELFDQTANAIAGGPQIALAEQPQSGQDLVIRVTGLETGSVVTVSVTDFFAGSIEKSGTAASPVTLTFGHDELVTAFGDSAVMLVEVTATYEGTIVAKRALQATLSPLTAAPDASTEYRMCIGSHNRAFSRACWHLPWDAYRGCEYKGQEQQVAESFCRQTYPDSYLGATLTDRKTYSGGSCGYVMRKFTCDLEGSEEEAVSCNGKPLSELDATEDKGTLCSDGTFYLGQHPEGEPLFAAACDIGRTFDASLNGGRGGCTGQWDLMAWNDGTSNWLDTSLPNYFYSAAGDYNGRNATTILASEDSSSADGTQPHEAAQGCDGYSAHGYGDWYLPAAGELDILWAATHPSASVGDYYPSWLDTARLQSSGTDFAQTFDSRIFSKSGCHASDSSVDQDGYPCYVWSASENYSGSAWARDLSYGYRSFTLHLPPHGKAGRFAARCVRR